MNVKKQSRLRRARRARAKISELRTNRLCVFRTPRHIYAQIIAPTRRTNLCVGVKPAMWRQQRKLDN
jgi:ribosomal protein L18